MKNYLVLVVLFGAQLTHAQLRIPAQSASAVVKQNIGLTEIEISYSRPSARDRTVFGELLPYGEFWRVGANAATKIEFSEAIFVDGNELNKGAYSLLAIPGVKTWTLNWYTYTSSDWNAYVDAKPILQLSLPVRHRDAPLESLEIHFQDITLDSATLLLEWQHSRLEIPFSVDENERILKSIDRTLAGPRSFDYYFAALYLHEKQIELQEALEYIQKVTVSDKALFFQVTREALILADLNRLTEAKKVAIRGLALSREARNKDFVRMNQKILDR